MRYILLLSVLCTSVLFPATVEAYPGQELASLRVSAVRPRAAIRMTAHLENVRKLYETLQEPGYFYLEDNYEALRRMQAECELADEEYLLESPADQHLLLDSTIRIHVMLALGGAVIAYNDLYDHHLEIAKRRLNRDRGFPTHSSMEMALKTVLQGYPLQFGRDLAQEYDRVRNSYASYLSKTSPVELVFRDLSTAPRTFPLTGFSIRAADPANSSPAAQLFADSLLRQLHNPIVKFWYLDYFKEEAANNGIHINADDYLMLDPTDQQKANWVSNELPGLLKNKAELRVAIHVPEGHYLFFASGASTPDGAQPNWNIRRSDGISPSRYVVSRLPGPRVEVRAESASLISREETTGSSSLSPAWSPLDLQLALNPQTRKLEGTIAGQSFWAINDHLGFQTQGEAAFRSNSDYEDHGTGSFLPRDKRAITSFLSKDLQGDFGAVIRLGDFQIGLLESLRYVRRERADHGGLLGQHVFSVNYITSSRATLGGYFTIPNSAMPIIKTAQVDQTLFEQTYLKIAKQAGATFQWNVTQSSYIEGSLGYISASRHGAGGVVRYVRPLPTRSNVQLTSEVGLNESFIGTKDSWRVGFGIRVATWGKDRSGTASHTASSAGATQTASITDDKPRGPLPIVVPRVRYETVTRSIRQGNRIPLASAGSDQSEIAPGSLVVLNGTQSSDPDGDSLSYEWTQLSGQPVVLEDRNKAIAKFVAGDAQVYSFQLIVIDVNGLRSSPALVTVRTMRIELPVVGRFEATPSQIRVGETFTLFWNAPNSARVRITGIDRDLPPTGTETLRPLTTTMFTMTAFNSSGGSTSASATVVVRPLLPNVISFKSTSADIRDGETAELSWDTTNATRVTIVNASQTQNVQATGTLSVRPTTTTTYNLVVYNDAGENVSAVVIVNVRPVLPELTITTTPDPPIVSAAKDESVGLCWNTRNAVRVTLNGNEVPTAGCRTIRPPAATYTFKAYNRIGEAAEQSVKISFTPF
jgi:hypothetical protein